MRKNKSKKRRSVLRSLVNAFRRNFIKVLVGALLLVLSLSIIIIPILQVI